MVVSLDMGILLAFVATRLLEIPLRDFLPVLKSGKTHNLTHTGTWSEKRQTAPSESSGVACVFSASGSHHLGHEGPHLLGCVVLGLPGGVGIGAEGKSSVVVAQHGGHRFHVHPILQGHGSEGVPIGYNKDKSENPVFSRVCGFVLVLFPLKNAPKMGVGRGGDKRSFHIKDKFLGD